MNAADNMLHVALALLGLIGGLAPRGGADRESVADDGLPAHGPGAHALTR